MSILFFILAFVAVSNATILSRFNEWLMTHNIRFRNEAERSHIFENWVSNDEFIWNEF